MRDSTITAVALGALALTACSGGDDSADAVVPSTTTVPVVSTTTTTEPAPVQTTEPPPTTTAKPEIDLSPMLIAVDDLPTGWSEQPVPDDDDPACGDHPDDDEAGILARAEAMFTHGPGEFLTHEVIRFTSPDAAISESKRVDALYADECAEYEWDGFDVTVGRMSFPQFGDETQAWQANLVRDDDAATSVAMITVRVSDTISVITYQRFTVDTALLEDVAGFAARRMAQPVAG